MTEQDKIRSAPAPTPATELAGNWMSARWIPFAKLALAVAGLLSWFLLPGDDNAPLRAMLVAGALGFAVGSAAGDCALAEAKRGWPR